MKTILVATDFTPAASNATDYAVLLAQALNANVYLLHVSTEMMPAYVGPEPWTVTISALRMDTEKRIQKERERLQTQYGVAVEGSILSGFKGDTINETAEQIQADLVVLGMQEVHKKRFPGSTAAKMIRKSSRPLLIVPEGASFSPIRNCTLAIDFAGIITSADLSVFFQLVNAFDAAVNVLHVAERNADLKASEVPAKLQMGVVLSKLTYSYEQLVFDNVEEGILNFVNNHPTDLLVMVAHHHSLFERLFSLTHTNTVSFGTKKPLLVIKTKPQAG